VEKISPVPPSAERATWSQATRAHLVHVYTASGVAFAFATAAEICAAETDVRLVFIYLFVSLFIDATDGPLARQFQVKRWAAGIDGRTIDDIVDYLTFTFLPLLLMWRMEWLPDPAALWIIPALVASLFGFANLGAKDEKAGFFLGFPSYWNVVAFYGGVWGHLPQGAWLNAALLFGLTVLTLVPVRFLYPNLTPHPWKIPVLAGAVLWMATLIWMLVDYPRVSRQLVWVSLIYPAFYTALSIHLTRRSRAATS
jgi:phosphatidylcholine synthase